jgi:hypothetical protein
MTGLILHKSGVKPDADLRLQTPIPRSFIRGEGIVECLERGESALLIRERFQKNTYYRGVDNVEEWRKWAEANGYSYRNTADRLEIFPQDFCTEFHLPDVSPVIRAMPLSGRITGLVEKEGLFYRIFNSYYRHGHRVQMVFLRLYTQGLDQSTRSKGVPLPEMTQAAAPH